LRVVLAFTVLSSLAISAGHAFSFVFVGLLVATPAFIFHFFGILARR
jgi:hypothetical protein